MKSSCSPPHLSGCYILAAIELNVHNHCSTGRNVVANDPRLAVRPPPHLAAIHLRSAPLRHCGTFRWAVCNHSGGPEHAGRALAGLGHRSSSSPSADPPRVSSSLFGSPPPPSAWPGQRYSDLYLRDDAAEATRRYLAVRTAPARRRRSLRLGWTARNCADIAPARQAGDIWLGWRDTAVSSSRVRRIRLSAQTDMEELCSRSLINTHQDTESKGLTTTRFMWFAKETKVGDQVQFWVYDSKGAEGKSPNIPIVAAASASKSASGGGGRASSTTHDASGKSPKASGGATVGGGGSASAKETGKAGSSTGSVKTAAPRGSAPASKDTEASNDLDTPLNTAAATMSTSAPIAPADTATVATTPVTTPAAAPVAPASAPTASSTSSLFSGDNTALYLGIGGVALALILVVALLLWWRGKQQQPEARRGRRDDRYERSLSKQPLSKRRRRSLQPLDTSQAERSLLPDHAASGSASSCSSAASDSSSSSWARRRRRGEKEEV
ncbi:hypothetical protein BJY59DRAFT_706001 [Rhodotorula toruloides]